MLNSDDHRALAERCVRLAQECSKPRVTQYLMALAANYFELAEIMGEVRRPPAPVIRLDQRRKKPGLDHHSRSGSRKRSNPPKKLAKLIEEHAGLPIELDV